MYEEHVQNCSVDDQPYHQQLQRKVAHLLRFEIDILHECTWCVIHSRYLIQQIAPDGKFGRK